MACLLLPCKTELLINLSVRSSSVRDKLQSDHFSEVFFLLHLLSHGKFWMYTQPFITNLQYENTISMMYVMSVCDNPCIHILSLLYRYSKLWWHTSATYTRIKSYINIYQHATKLCWHASYIYQHAAWFFAFQVSDSLIYCLWSNYDDRKEMKVTSVDTCLVIFKLSPQPRMMEYQEVNCFFQRKIAGSLIF